jgi:hypothetical protein
LKQDDVLLHALFNWPEVDVAARELAHFTQKQEWTFEEALDARVLKRHDLPELDPIISDLWTKAEQHGVVISVQAQQPQVFTKCC